MIERKDLIHLRKWKNSLRRKPLIVRGARQVGKTELVREFGKEFEVFIEINFDETPEKEDFFKFSIDESIHIIEADSGKKLIDGKTLIFLDEIQSAPAILPKLRYFYEKRPGLHVIAAGSLLEFLLSDHQFSMPVGRIEYHFLGPLTFEEFLKAKNDESLLTFIKNYQPGDSFPESLHQKLQNNFNYYSLIGGMPEAQAAWLETEDINEVQKIHSNILQTYEDDFSKYGKRINPNTLRLVLKRTPPTVGTKLRYVNIDRELSQPAISRAIELLTNAGLISRVYHSDGNGIPLAAEESIKKFKPLLLDTGLYCSSSGLRLTDIKLSENLLMVNRGALAEQVIGQHLLYRGPSWLRPQLHYWHRDKRGASSEIDYMLSNGTDVLPIEVKAGKTGKMRSLHTFAALKNTSTAVRFNSDLPSISNIHFHIQEIGTADYKLITLPLYMVEQLGRLLDSYSKYPSGAQLPV